MRENSLNLTWGKWTVLMGFIGPKAHSMGNNPTSPTSQTWSEVSAATSPTSNLTFFKRPRLTTLPQEIIAENQMLETALLLLTADVYGDLVDEGVAMYRTVGRDEALMFKREWLPQVQL